MRKTLRSLRRSPGVVAAVLVCLALGVGVNVALFTVVDALLLRPPSGVARADELRRLVVPTPTARPGEYMVLGRGLSRAELRALRDRPGTFAAVAGQRYPLTTAMAAPVGGERQPVVVECVTGEWFPLLGVRAARGRLLTPDDDRAGAPAVAVVSDRFWRTAFGADSAIVGRRVRLDGGVVEVVGVAPPNFAGLGVVGADVWVAAARSEVAGPPGAGPADPEAEWFTALVRPTPGTPDARLAAEAGLVLLVSDARLPATSWEARQPGGPYRRVAVERLRGRRSPASPPAGDLDVPGWLFAATGAVLLVTCANAAGLLLARGEQRRAEFSTRAALGERPLRLAGALLAESAALAVGGALAGIVLAAALVRGVELLPGAPPIGGLAWRVGVVAAVLAGVAAVAAGVLPALVAARTDPATALARATPRAAGRAGGWARVLVAAQLAASFALLATGGLFARSLIALERVDFGLDVDRTAEVVVPAPDRGWPQGAAMEALDAALVERVRRVNGAAGAAAVASSPLGAPLLVRAAVGGATPEQAFAMAVDPEFFPVARVRVLRGRAFTADDRAGTQPVVVVSERFADAHWPGADPRGRCVDLGAPGERRCATVVGVARGIRFLGPRAAPPPMLYLPLAQYASLHAAAAAGPSSALRVLVRTADASGSPTLREVAAALRAAVRGGDPRFAAAEVRLLTDGLVARELAPYRYAAVALAAFSAAALTVAAVGLYAAVAYAVVRRRTEIGVRLAIGARPRDVVRHVVLGVGGAVAAGVAAGVPAALAAGYAVQSRLVGVRPWDPATLAAVTVVMVGAAFLAAWLPARRAARVDPLLAIRSR